MSNPKKDLKQTLKSFHWSLFLSLVLECIIVIGIYTYGANSAYLQYVVSAYFVIALALVVAYITYNRGMRDRGVTPEMLPHTMSDKEKEEYIAAAREREKKSKWILFLAIPFILALILDFLNLFWLDGILGK